MKNSKFQLILGSWCLALFFAPLAASAQSYSIDWHKVSGGGGTIGQPDAGGPMIGGDYSLTGGFWALFAVQTPGAPLLTITYANNQAILSWPALVTGWTLQTNGNLNTTNWSNYPGNIVNNTVTNSPLKGTLFFRLTHP